MHKYGPCSSRRTLKTASVYVKRGIVEKIFLEGGVKIEKNSILNVMCRGMFYTTGNR
jgi:hypothetical protein